MIKSDPVLYRAVCDVCDKVSKMVGMSPGKAEGAVLDLTHSQVGRPWVKNDDKLYCDDCAVKLLGTEGYFAATDKRVLAATK